MKSMQVKMIDTLNARAVAPRENKLAGAITGAIFVIGLPVCVVWCFFGILN